MRPPHTFYNQGYELSQVPIQSDSTYSTYLVSGTVILLHTTKICAVQCFHYSMTGHCLA